MNLMRADKRFSNVVTSLKRKPNVSVGASRKGFGSSALCVGGKIFAMVSSKGGFVVKLPKARVDELVNSGIGMRFELMRGRVMKEWLEVRPASDQDWVRLASEALAYVAANGK